jgi:small conductance mechanosensitive channel
MFWHDLFAELRRQFITPEKLAVYLTRAVSVILIAVAWFLVYLVAGRVVRRLLRGGSRLVHERRGRTLVTIVHSVIGYVILFVAVIMCLRVLGVDYSAILAGAGVVGLAVGFGAQTLIRDFISGFFLLLEDLVSVGDWISVGDISGSVETVGLRITRIRALDGTLHVVPNGELTRFGNANRGFMRALVTVDLAYEQDPGRGMALARSVADQWYEENRAVAVEPPAVQGLLNFGESGVKIRVVCKVKPMQHWTAEQALRLRLKQAFAASGIEIPLPRRVVYLRSDAEAGPDKETPH